MLTIIAAVLYLLLSCSYWLRRPLPMQPWLERAVLLVAVALHTIGLQRAIWQDGTVDLGLFKAASLLGLIIAILVLFNQLRRGALDLSTWLLPISAITALAASFFTSGFEAREASFGVLLHVMFALLAYALFTVTLVYALVVRAQDRGLKHHKLSAFLLKLPPLQTMEHTQFKLAWISFILLTLAMVVGYTAADDFLGQQIAHKMILTLVAWCFFAALFVGHHFWGWRAVMTLRWLVSGYLLLTLGFFGSKIVVELILNQT